MSKELIEKLRRAIIRPFDLNPVADRIEQLEAERDRLTKRVAELEMLYNYVFDRAKEITAERDELKADAMRYRWLRDNKAHNNTHCWHFQHGLVIPGLLTLDAAIDAAITKGEKNAQA